MKYYYFFVFTLVCNLFVRAQEYKAVGGDFKFYNRSECLSPIQRQNILNELDRNVKVLKAEGKIRDTSNDSDVLVHPNFIWPVVKNPTAPYANVWSISNYVDHNPGYPNLIQDWNCGPRSYDTSSGYNHQGIDIFTWPFSWYQMLNNQAWVVAAAPGIIVGKDDGNFDSNCSFNSSNWNAVYIQHSDGSRAWYGHMKNGSLTSKLVGDTVAEGEYLGVIGSSGNSTGPHLHFEIFNASYQLVDPYQGPCNNWASSTDSWWQEQKNYQDPKINAVLTHTATPVFNGCPQLETTNLSDDFSNGSVYVAVYLADQLPGTSGVLELKRPDNSTAVYGTLDLAYFSYASYWVWTFDSFIFNQTGSWVATFTYQGQTVSHNFNYGTLGVAANFNENFYLYPNPVKDVLNIDSKGRADIKQVVINNLIGEKVMEVKSNFDNVNLSTLKSGVYLLHIDSDSGYYTSKFVKE